MVKHIVLYTLKEEVNKDEAVKLIASKLEPLVGQIPGLRHMEIRRCYSGMDYALYSEFDSAEDDRHRMPWLPCSPAHSRGQCHNRHRSA